MHWRNLAAEAESETSEMCCLLASSPWLTQFAFLYNPGPPAQGWYHPQWAGPVSIMKIPHRLVRGQAAGDIFLTDVPSS